MYPIAQLLDIVFVIASLIGEQNDLLGGFPAIVSDVKEVANFIRQSLFAAGNSAGFFDDHHTVDIVAFARLIVEFGDVLTHLAQVLVASLFYDVVLDAPFFLPRIGFYLVLGRPLK